MKDPNKDIEIAKFGTVLIIGKVGAELLHAIDSCRKHLTEAGMDEQEAQSYIDGLLNDLYESSEKCKDEERSWVKQGKNPEEERQKAIKKLESKLPPGLPELVDSILKQ